MPSLFEITKTAHFDAAHYLSVGEDDHRYRRLHGHSFQVEVSLQGPLTIDGWVNDFAGLDRALKSVASELDHGLLNDRPGLEVPTLERLCLYFADRLQPQFPNLSAITVSRPTIGERCVLRFGAGPAL